MLNIFSDEIRRDPFPVYAQMRSRSPVFYVPPPFDGWLVFDYEGAKRALNDHEAFSSQVPAPRNWFIFLDAPAHTKLRALISRAFTPGTVSNLEPYIRQLSRELLDAAMERGQMDLATELSIPLPMKVISTMIGIPPADWSRFKHWSDSILKLSYARSGGPEAEDGAREFKTVTIEMNDYLGEMIAERQASPKSDLLTRLVQAEVDGERLTQDEILGFFQLLVVGGQETTTNLINNAVLSFMENPDQLTLLRGRPQLLACAIEEVLRYRSPLQWVMRTPRRDIELHGQRIPAGKLVLPMIGSANRDPRVFPNADKFEISRDPNPHLAFGHGIHACLGAALARLETKIVLSDFLARVKSFALASDTPWEPRKALHVLGPTRLPLRFEPAERLASAP